MSEGIVSVKAIAYALRHHDAAAEWMAHHMTHEQRVKFTREINRIPGIDIPTDQSSAGRLELNMRYHSPECTLETSHTWEASHLACGTVKEINEAPYHLRTQWIRDRKLEGYQFFDGDPNPRLSLAEQHEANPFSKAKVVMLQLGYSEEQTNQLLVEFAEHRIIKNEE